MSRDTGVRLFLGWSEECYAALSYYGLVNGFCRLRRLSREAWVRVCAGRLEISWGPGGV